MAQEEDREAIRLFCTGCGRDRWIEVPEERGAGVSVGFTKGAGAVGRRCADCGADISSRHQNAYRCLGCADLANKRPRDESRRRPRKVAV